MYFSNKLTVLRVYCKHHVLDIFFFDLLGEFSENRQLYDFKIGPTVEEGMTKLRNLDRRPSSRIYRIGVNGEQQNYYVTTEAQKMNEIILSTFSWVKLHDFFKQIHDIQWFLYKTVI